MNFKINIIQHIECAKLHGDTAENVQSTDDYLKSFHLCYFTVALKPACPALAAWILTVLRLPRVPRPGGLDAAALAAGSADRRQSGDHHHGRREGGQVLLKRCWNHTHSAWEGLLLNLGGGHVSPEVHLNTEPSGRTSCS